MTTAKTGPDLRLVWTFVWSFVWKFVYTFVRKSVQKSVSFYPDLGSDASSVWNFCACFSDVISRENQWSRREMSAVFLGFEEAS